MAGPTGTLFDAAVWQPALEKYAAVTHLTVTVYDASARVVCGPLHPTPLFALFEEYEYDSGIFADCAARCLAQPSDRPALVVSAHGLAVIGTSLLLEDRIVGSAVAGYALTEFAQSVAIDRLARQAGIPFRHLWELARRQQPVPSRRLILHGELLQVLGDTILRENYRTRQYEETAAQLAATATSKDEFLSLLSHELRTPMTSILGWTQLLEHTSYDSELMPAAIQNIERSARAQARIIEDMLDLSHMLVGQLSIHCEQVEVMAMVRDSISSAEPLAAARGISLEAEGDSATLLGDPQRLRQVFGNLLANALKFSSSGSRIRVVVERVNRQVSILVIDEGRGIKPDFLPLLFRRFSQQQKGEYGGFGLGLAIAQHIVERHGGTIEAESAGEGKGATFRVILPTVETLDTVPDVPAPSVGETG